MIRFPVYNVKTSSLATANTISSHGIQIPEVVQYSHSNIQLSLSVTDSDLVVNERYFATITTISGDGERGHNVTVEFGKCCVAS